MDGKIHTHPPFYIQIGKHSQYWFDGLISFYGAYGYIETKFHVNGMNTRGMVRLITTNGPNFGCMTTSASMIVITEQLSKSKYLMGWENNVFAPET